MQWTCRRDEEDCASLRHSRVLLHGHIDRSQRPILVGPRGARDLGMSYAYNVILPFCLADGYGQRARLWRIALRAPLERR